MSTMSPPFAETLDWSGALTADEMSELVREVAPSLDVAAVTTALARRRIAVLRDIVNGRCTVEEGHEHLARLYRLGRALGAPPDAAWETPSYQPLPPRRRRSR